MAEKTTRSKAVSLYFQGMDGDQLADGDRSVTLAPLSSPAIRRPAGAPTPVGSAAPRPPTARPERSNRPPPHTGSYVHLTT
ncbi:MULTISPECIES: hypothetical protein [Streptomyces]|uniref:Uncharacterized protein n=1 Tax=Streptomyces rimosus subsp. rimosus (strain ATCC 10970 / DSM 40260 / JCM 4667 / NRRL 2234) TaxID=1265868 RepID=A0A8A1UWT1_STRR1|nr:MULTISPECIES: hypothetical protein [Streptomyces]MYT41448.1 hypothetical protein [Streptomyces sp. SID5471]KOT43541.1 hypothetical protein ADK84_08100 [Streptomyces sp. NRRL WC-3701]KOT82771.1 hypothetical protein ADK47_09400 [Streptomyces rimosus subsp. rimosus]QDA03374.1 hypothetical protein CTZ40_06095 [Streptomyces rimosus]QEV74653.1 hypothetical protein CP984_06085 [Streptomyces rimosus]